MDRRFVDRGSLVIDTFCIQIHGAREKPVGYTGIVTDTLDGVVKMGPLVEGFTSGNDVGSDSSLHICFLNFNFSLHNNANLVRIVTPGECVVFPIRGQPCNPQSPKPVALGGQKFVFGVFSEIDYLIVCLTGVDMLHVFL